ncbi:schwannomin interacting protein 1 [Brevipalpus obovatus]|uniref:schwannomin interacting protein 1 n=1 Tax=Brevipalpus obovatus TaxID=246614 RepID=UPI003D9E9628
MRPVRSASNRMSTSSTPSSRYSASSTTSTPSSTSSTSSIKHMNNGKANRKYSSIGLERRSISMNDREEIRRRLAESESESESSPRDKYTKKSYLNRKADNSSDLQMCFLNETPDVFVVQGVHGLEKMRKDAFDQIRNNCSLDRSINHLTDGDGDDKLRISNQKSGDLMVNMRRNKMERFRFILNSARPNGQFPSDFHRYHSLIVAEAKFALGQAKEMANAQMMVEREKHKRSSIAHLIDLPSGKDGRLTRNVLHQMSASKLKVLVNDYHGRIKALNDELVDILQERDELHMEQDSILVDIEDMTIFLLRRLRHQQTITT